jgi:hypothetical protein
MSDLPRIGNQWNFSVAQPGGRDGQNPVPLGGQKHGSNVDVTLLAGDAAGGRWPTQADFA